MKLIKGLMMKCNKCRYHIDPIVLYEDKDRVRVVCPNSICGLQTNLYTSETIALSEFNKINTF